MRRATSVFILLLLLAVAVPAWAGAAEDIAALIQQREKYFAEGNVDGLMGTIADNAAYLSAGTPFRMEGKDAIRAFYAALFQNFPTRRNAFRQLSIRVYANDSAAVVNTYEQANLVDTKGQATALSLRVTATWVKIGGQWRIVDVHNSKLP